MSRVIMHIDMDAFFASVEQVDDPSLAGKPVIIGRDGRGVVSAASYEARVYGVRSAMPVVTARRLCPHGVFLPGRMRRYAEVSRQLMGIFSAYSPLLEQASVDEAYLDITGTGLLFGPPGDLAVNLKARVLGETGLSCSVGISPVKFVSKIASDFQKPGGLTIVAKDQVLDFLSVLPVEKIPGVGKRTLALLKRFGIHTVGDVRGFPEAFLADRLGEWGSVLWQRAHGRGSDTVRPDRPMKSSGAENTFAADTLDREILNGWLLRQSERVGRDLRRHGLFGRTVTVKIKFEDFKQITRARTLPMAVNADALIYRAAAAILANEPLAKPVRLIGVTVSGFTSSPGGDRGSLVPGPEVAAAKLGRLDKAVDTIRDKYGLSAIKRAKLSQR